VVTQQDVDQLVRYFCCAKETALYGPYRRVAGPDGPIPPAQLLPGRFYRYHVTDDEDTAVDLHVYVGLAGVGGALWEQEVRVLTRAGASRLTALPEVMGGGAQDATSAARAGISAPDVDFAVIATRGSSATLADQDAMDALHADKGRALSQFMALADGLTELHDLGVSHRNLWPEAIYVSASDDAWLARFEMSVLVADLVRSALVGSAAMHQALREMYLRQGALSMAYCPPERLAFLFPGEGGAGVVEGPPGDVYSLGALACEMFGMPLERSSLGSTPVTRETHTSLAAELHERLKSADLPKQLADLVATMLAAEPAGRPTAAEVARSLHQEFEGISAYLEDRQVEEPYLLLYLPREFADTVQKWYLTFDHTTRTGRDELGSFIAADLRHARLVHAPEGAGRYVGGDDPTGQKAAQYVLIGEQVAWFCQKWAPRRNGPTIDKAMIIKYVAQLHAGFSASRLAELARNPLGREVPEITALSSDIDRTVLEGKLLTRPSWDPLLRAVSSASAASADDMADEAALDLLLRYQDAELRARVYAYECDDTARGEIEVVLDRQRDRNMITRDSLLTMYATDPRRRPALGDFFGSLENDEGSADVEIVADDRGRPAPALHRSEWIVATKTGPDRVRLRPKSGRPVPPKTGWLRPADFYGSWTAISRQTEARLALTHSATLLHQLRKPSSIKTLEHRWSQAGSALTGGDARQAVREMLSYLPFYAVQGPPGTGKTTVAAEAVAAQLAAAPATRILVSAQSTFALDNLAERILSRIGAIDDKADPAPWWDGAALRVTSAQGTPPQGKMGLWRKGSVADRRADMIRRRVTEQLEDGVPGQLPDGDAGKLRDVLRDWKNLLDGSGGENVLPELADRIEHASNLVFATCGTATAEAVTPGGIRDTFDWVIVEEAAKAWPTELAMPLARGTRWTLIGDHRQLPAHRRDDFARFLGDCLDDKDPGIRLLADRRDQIMDVFDTFRRVFKRADSAELSVPEQATLPLHTLTTQFRMARPIAEVVSRVFYPRPGSAPLPDGLPPGGLSTGREVGPLPLRAPAFLRGKSLVWLDTGDDPECATAIPTWSNPGEANVIAALIGGIEPAPRPHRDEYSADPLAVLTPYRRQADLLSAHAQLKPHVYTVHAFQGREADIVVVSLVRTARGADPVERPWESLGHLSRKELVNVMVSRARRLLVLVGKYEHFAAFDRGEAGFWGQVCRAVGEYGTVVPSGSLRR
jgi:AAA domain/Protein kinase domain